MKYLVLFFLCITPLAYATEVYMQTDSQGNTVYSDKPTNTAVKLNLPTTNGGTPTPSTPTTVTVTTPASTTPSTTTVIIKKPYTTFALTAPADQATIQNQPTIPVDITIDPALQEGDKIQVYLDGVAWGPAGASTHFEFTAPDRGTHQISAKLIDNNAQVLKTTTSNTIYIHHAALGGQGP